MPSLFRLLAGLTAAVVLVQAMLAGQWLGGNLEMIAIHGWLGSGTFLLILALAALSLLGSRQGWLDGRALAVTVVLAGLVVAQLGLGYAGRDSNVAASLHVPLGVLIFGLLMSLFVAVVPARLTAVPAHARATGPSSPRG